MCRGRQKSRRECVCALVRAVRADWRSVVLEGDSFLCFVGVALFYECFSVIFCGFLEVSLLFVPLPTVLTQKPPSFVCVIEFVFAAISKKT